MVDDILEATARILEEAGPSGVSTNKVAARAGVSVGSLYQYFPNRDALTGSLILRAHEQIVAGIEDMLERTDGMAFDEALDTMIGIAIEMQFKRPRLSRVLEVEEERLPKSEPLVALERQIDELNRAFIGRFAHPGCPPSEIATAATDMICIVRGLLDGALAIPGFDIESLHLRVRRALAGYLAPIIEGPVSSPATPG
jgi:AcrR family transcriptional regulator